jgi:DNA-binding response OmpR family regulator
MSKILLVDDDAFIAEIYSNKLRASGFEVETAPDGDAALKYLQAARPEALVLDLMLPRFNGFEVMNFVRSQKELKETPIVVLSNFFLGSSERETAAELANAVLCKSKCTPEILLGTLNQLLNRRKTGNGADTGKKRSEKERDPAVEEKYRRDFLENGRETLATLRQLNDAFVQSKAPHIRKLRLLNFYRKVHFLTAVAAMAGYESIALLASAFEALLLQLHDHAERITPSTLQTIAQTLEFFRLLFANADAASAGARKQNKAMVVDDDRVTTLALVNALRSADFEVVGIQEPLHALKKLQAEDFALILLDIQMPEMDGFQLCKEIRQLEQYLTTQIIFVTGQDDFESRVHSVLSGGNDLIAKPIMPIELAVKAWTHLLRSRLPAPWNLG